MASSVWKKIPCLQRELRLDKTLACGQSFRWKFHALSGAWVGVIKDRVWKFWQTDTHLYYQVIPQMAVNSAHSQAGSKATLPSTTKEDREATLESTVDVKTERTVDVKTERTSKHTARTGRQRKRDAKGMIKVDEVSVKEEGRNAHSDTVLANKFGDSKSLTNSPNLAEEEIIRDYFQLSVNLNALYSLWASQDKNFAEVSTDFLGVRMLRQDPVENLFAFICSSNNNISRIASMVEKLCNQYGDLVCEVDGTEYFSFPPVTRLAGKEVEQELRALGFGYRAKFIQQTARMLTQELGEDWLASLRKLPYTEARTQLMRLPGVGAKVADCVCLMSLDHPQAIPVDTHVWQIAARHYLPKLQQSKSLTDRLYQEIGDHFRSLWGDYAGWAHSVLFAADLKHFKTDKKTVARTEDSGKAPVTKKSEK